MPFKHIYSPTKGLVTSIPAGQLDAEMSPQLSGVYLKDGEVVSDYGHTDYPSPGDTKTNLLNGIFMRADNLLLASGTERLVAHTTTNAYEYNTSTTTWDCITQGALIEDCEDAWTANANVTATADSTIKLRGTNSSKLVIAAAFTTGVAAHEAVSSIDLTTHTGVHFWVYSTVATTAGDIRLLLDDTAACVSPLETLSIPALAANTWTPIYVAYATPANLGAVISVGLNVNVDIGAMTVYIDDVRSVLAFTGTASNLFSVTQMTDTLIITNGVDQPKKYTGTAATGEVALATALAAGSITTSEVMITAKDHLVAFNNTENGADAPQRASWTNIGKIEDWTGGTAGYQDLTEDNSWIIAVDQLSTNTWAVYKEASIVLMEWVGGQTPFRFTPMIKNKTIAGKASVLNNNGIHYVIGTRDVYMYNGGPTTENIDKELKRTLFSEVDFTYILRSFIVYLEEDDEIQFWLPTSTQYPDVVYCYDNIMKVWYKKSRTMTGWGIGTSSSTSTFGNLGGTFGDHPETFGSTLLKSNTPIYLVGDSTGQVFKLDKTTLNNDGSAITNEFQTPDFLYPKTEFSVSDLTSSKAAKSLDSLNRFFRVPQVVFEAKGQSITVEYSSDGGATWNPCQSGGTNVVTLTSAYTFYQLDMDGVFRMVRFRFRNVTVSSGFNLRYYGFYWLPRSIRR